MEIAMASKMSNDDMVMERDRSKFGAILSKISQHILYFKGTFSVVFEISMNNYKGALAIKLL